METRPTVLVVDDESSLRWVLRKGLTKAGYDVEEAEDAHTGLRLLRQREFAAVILDINLPGLTGLEALEEIAAVRAGTPVLVITAQNSMSNAIEAMRRGAVDYFTKPFDLDEVLLVLAKVQERRELEAEVSRLRHAAGEVDPLEEMAGRSDAMREVFKRIGQVAARETTVLIRGESGTGKELVARAIHYNSARRHGPFVAVNCAAIPAELLESELFGHERGAFTGAVSRKRGRFERADGGSLFLDEIGDMAPALQTRLLRVLQEKEIERVGGEESVAVDVRILAATNVDLEDAVRRGQFREDLYYRLNVVTVILPPLRDRPDDIPILAEHFIRRGNRELGTAVDGITEEALQRLQRYGWPGNVRELENCVKRAMVLASGRVLGAAEIEAAGFGATPAAVQAAACNSLEADILPHLERMVGEVRGEGDLYRQAVGAVEGPLLRLVLARTGGNQLQAARLLGINRNTLRKKLREAGIATDVRG
jgi:two-component system nitrogen regulation response regulator GlnG